MNAFETVRGTEFLEKVPSELCKIRKDLERKKVVFHFHAHADELANKINEKIDEGYDFVEVQTLGTNGAGFYDVIAVFFQK